MNWLNKLAAVELYYHGTSASRLSTIMSEGLNINPKRKRAWETDEDDHSRVSFGGVYLTKNLMTAIGAGGQANQSFGFKYGDPRAVLMVQVENRTPSVLVDEDKLPTPTSAINLAFRVNANDWYCMSWLDNNFSDMDKVVDEYIKLLNVFWKIPDPRFTQNLRPFIAEVIKAYVKRECAIGLKHASAYDKIRWKSDFPNINLDELTLERTEAEWRNVSNNLMQKAHRLTSFKSDSFSENIRVLEPITFSGKNKIVFAARIEKDEKYYEKVQIVFNRSPAALPMFMADYARRIGNTYILYDEKGQVLYEKERALDI